MKYFLKCMIAAGFLFFLPTWALLKYAGPIACMFYYAFLALAFLRGLTVKR